jgi:hypothetical protein
VRAGGAVAALGATTALAFPHPWAIVVGFGAVGAGLSAVFPTVLATAARLPGAVAGPAIAAVSMCGYTALLAGPPAIGAVAAVLTLRGGLALVAASSAVVVFLARVFRRVPSHGAAGEAVTYEAAAVRAAA